MEVKLATSNDKLFLNESKCCHLNKTNVRFVLAISISQRFGQSPLCLASPQQKAFLNADHREIINGDAATLWQHSTPSKHSTKMNFPEVVENLFSIMCANRK